MRTRPWFMILLLPCGLLLPKFALAHAAPYLKKVLTPDQAAYQQAWARWLEQYNALRQEAQHAYNAEMSREKAGDCPNADNPRVQEECLSQEISITHITYATVTTALRSMLALEHPKMPGEQPYSRPTGTPPSAKERVAELDQLEAASTSYRKLAAGAAYDEYKGGSITPVASAGAAQRLVRPHLQELAYIYETEFTNR